jgi:hypothetical protein
MAPDRGRHPITRSSIHRRVESSDGMEGNYRTYQGHTASRHKRGIRARALAQASFCERQLILDQGQ